MPHLSCDDFVGETTMSSSDEDSAGMTSSTEDMQRKFPVTWIVEEEFQEAKRVTSDLSNLFYTDLQPYAEPEVDVTAEFLQSLVNFLIEFVQQSNDRSNKVLSFQHPEHMGRVMRLGLSHEPRTLKQILDDCKMTLECCVKTGHPRYMNQISNGLDIISLAGEWLTAATNTNMFTYEIAPAFVLMEQEVIQEMIRLIGWPDGDGIFAPGGTISNLYAVNVARHYAAPQIKQCGMFGGPRLAIFTSAYSHYSIKQAAALTGIGIDMCISVPADNEGCMLPAKLDEAIQASKEQGFCPFLVVATAGTTVYGAFDPLNAIADVCAKHNMWLHVDAAWGGGLLLSPKHRHLLQGIQRADSVAWNPHKLMGVSLQCSAFLLQHKNLLHSCNNLSADYLFQQDKHYDVSYDTGDKSLQCGRRNDIFKLWLMWRAKGTAGFAQQIDHYMELAKYFTQRLQCTTGFTLVQAKPMFLNICYWYIPKSIDTICDANDRLVKLHTIAPKIKQRMMVAGTAMVGYQPDRVLNKPNFFRLIISNQAVRREDLDFIISETERFGSDL